MAAIIQENLTLEQKLTILADSAKYDVACTSSGVARAGKQGEVGNSVACGICHTFAADGRCVSLLKILLTNECIYDCKYCINRSSNDVVRASFTPEEVCTLTMQFYRRNYIEGLFLSSGILHSPDYTMELIVKTLRMLREVHHFNGYIHCKSIPGARQDLIEMAGWYADRISVNLELPTAEGLRQLAPHKNRKNILTPMRQVQNGIEESREILGMTGGNKGAYWHTKRRQQGLSIETMRQQDAIEFAKQDPRESRLAMFRERDLNANEYSKKYYLPREEKGYDLVREENNYGLSLMPKGGLQRGFAPAGQSTQMIIGATQETDYEIMAVSEALYQKFDLKRVFYSAFIRVNDDSSLPIIPGGPPLLREHRLYQADWLLRYYGFEAQELLTKERPNFNTLVDPKCNWAVGHLEQFPVEINKADYFTLLRVPGIGPKSAQRIVAARRSAVLDFKDIKRMGVVIKRAQYFITCKGKMLYPTKIEERFILSQLIETGERLPKHLIGETPDYKQLSLFDDMHLAV